MTDETKPKICVKCKYCDNKRLPFTQRQCMATSAINLMSGDETDMYNSIMAIKYPNGNYPHFEKIENE